MDDREQQAEAFYAIEALCNAVLDHLAAVFNKMTGELPGDQQDSYHGCQ